MIANYYFVKNTSICLKISSKIHTGHQQPPTRKNRGSMDQRRRRGKKKREEKKRKRKKRNTWSTISQLGGSLAKWKRSRVHESGKGATRRGGGIMSLKRPRFTELSSRIGRGSCVRDAWHPFPVVAPVSSLLSPLCRSVYPVRLK